MTFVRRRDRYRKKARYVRYFGIFTFSLPKKEVKRLDYEIDNIEDVRRDRIKKREDKIIEYKRRTEKLEPTVDLVEIESLVNSCIDRGGEVGYFSKLFLKRTFDNIDEVVYGLDKLPHHTKFGVDFYGTEGFGTKYGVSKLDLELYKELIKKYNEVVDIDKSKSYLYRSLARSAFIFLEGFLNCVAYNVILEKYGNLDENDMDLLTDRNPNNRLGTYDKIKRYTEYADGDPEDLYAGVNDDTKYIKDAEKIYRHSLIHPRPHENFLTNMSEGPDKDYEYIEKLRKNDTMMNIPYSTRETAFMGISKDKSKEIAQKSIHVVEAMSEKLDNKYAYYKLYKQNIKDNGKFEVPEKDGNSYVSGFGE